MRKRVKSSLGNDDPHVRKTVCRHYYVAAKKKIPQAPLASDKTSGTPTRVLQRNGFLHIIASILPALYYGFLTIF
jgi:hypothetical protein